MNILAELGQPEQQWTSSAERPVCLRLPTFCCIAANYGFGPRADIGVYAFYVLGGP
jgi:hypothetical protein